MSLGDDGSGGSRGGGGSGSGSSVGVGDDVAWLVANGHDRRQCSKVNVVVMKRSITVQKSR